MNDSEKVLDAFENIKDDLGYEGCRNCQYQIEPLRACEWLERRNARTVYLICPRWEKRTAYSEAIEKGFEGTEKDYADLV